MTPDQVRKLKQAGASAETILEIETEDVRKERGVSSEEAEVIAKERIDNALSPANRDTPIPANTIDPRTQGTMTLEDQNKNVQASEDAFEEFAKLSKENRALKEAAFSSKDPKEIAKAIESSKKLQNTANTFADFISSEQGSAGAGGFERPLPPNIPLDPNELNRFKKMDTPDTKDDNIVYPELKDTDPNEPLAKVIRAEGEQTGILPQVDPREYWSQAGMTPDAAAQAMIGANVQNIAPIFQTPFKDYLGRTARNYQLFNPSGETGSAGFLKYLAERESLGGRSQDDIWNQVQGILGGRYNEDPLASAQLGSRFGIGIEGADAAQQRQQLAMNLLSQGVNPLYRDTYRDIMSRDMSRAQMENPIWQDNPLAWAAYTQTGQIPQTIQNLQPTLKKSIQSSFPRFNSDGSIADEERRLSAYGDELNQYNIQTKGWN